MAVDTRSPAGRGMGRRQRFQRLALALAALLATACQNPVSPGQHLRAHGVSIRDGTDELVRAHGTETTGELVVPAGQELGPLTVHMLNRQGDALERREGYWLRVTSQAPDVARWERADETEWGGVLVGVAPGEAELEFCNMHGAVGRGHPDGCQAVTVTVSAS